MIENDIRSTDTLKDQAGIGNPVFFLCMYSLCSLLYFLYLKLLAKRG